ncbi:Ig-like domain-containing protein [Flavobacterium petrolei]|uniref:Ig-like domain-containing protein n=1 Tax=Flavobacterium petrolei TaxID=2259594 RepID=UPI0037582A51
MNKKLLLQIAFFFTFVLSYGQSASKYCFAPVNGTYVPLTGAIGVLGLTSTKDDGFSSIFPLDTTTPFNFVFGGVSYSQIQVSSNGLLSFKNTAINETFYGKTATDISDRKPFLAPLWDDLANTSVPRYVVTGSAPNRIFKIEWSGQKWNYLSAANVISFQVWLYETSNIIEYIYNRGTANINGAPAATIGIYDAASTSLTLSNSSTNPTTSSTAVLATINAKPASGQIYRFTPNVTPTGSVSQVFCASTSPTVASLAATGTDIKWYNAVTGGSALPSSTPLINGTHYYATQTISGCESSTRFDVTASVSNTTVPTGTALQMYCSGAKVSNLTATGTAIKWYTTSSGGSALATTTDLVNGTNYYATQTVGGCESSTRFDVTVIINSAPTITPNKVDETCSTTNNGSISPTLSGGITSVRYIKLTQKYNVDAWQQVAEIQAFEVFTGTNVALSSLGSVATGSSVWQNSAGPNYIPSNINNGVISGNTFWHSASSNINEWVQIDLQSGKNLDKIRIYNRTDCCSQRGQNMLLELFDGSNKLLYSKNIDLYQSGANVVDVNILDLSWADGANTLNRTGLDSGTYILNYADAIGCSESSPINIGSSIIAAPTQGTITPITCNVPLASVILNNLPSVGTWTLTQSGTYTATTTGTGSSATISGLAPGTYNFSVSIGGCSSSNLEAVEIDSLQETVWNGAWSNGLPNSDKKLIFTANYNQTTDLVACSCEVKSGNVTVSSGKTMTLTNELKVSGGIMKFENNASLVQINEDPTINSGNITYQRETVTSVDKFDFTYWSSPVSGQTLYNTSPNTLADKYFSFDAVNNNWIQENSLTKVMEPGIGYIIRGPQNNYAPNPIGTYRANFIGEPNNGTIPVEILVTDASYLLGNPYPSALDADLFLQDNDGVIDGTLYFWTHNTDIAPSGSNYIYDSDDYASYNLLGGVGTAAASDVNPVPTIPAGEIASGQGFFASSIALGTLNFTNTMRLGGSTNSQFFRSNSKSKKNASFDKNRLWLNFSNTEGAFKQTLIGYATGATNEYERTFDGISFDGNTFVDFYSILEDKNFVIQGRALPFLQSDEVPLGYKTTIKGNFTITIFQTDGFFTAQNVFLEDKMLGVIHNLKEASYNFTTEKGVFNERFVLRYTDKTLVTGDFESEDKTIVVFKEKNELKIKSEFETMKRVTIFDLLGKKVFEETLKDVNEFRTSNIILKNQIVIVKVVLTNGQVIAKKVSY